MIQNKQEAVVAAGCFWCVESEFQALPGVISVESGYTGGTIDNPTYEQVLGKKTGHVEAVRITYDPAKISYEKLLEAFWLIHDPTQENGQGVDLGFQYLSRIFVRNAEERAIAEKSKLAAQRNFKDPIVTQILDASPFYMAEDYHQDYYEKKGIEYQDVFSLDGKSTTIRKYEKWGIR